MKANKIVCELSCLPDPEILTFLSRSEAKGRMLDASLCSFTILYVFLNYILSPTTSVTTIISSGVRLTAAHNFIPFPQLAD